MDPIDGTKNYVRGVPVWATLISLLVDGVPVVGVVSAPALARRWWAAEGMGAWRTFSAGGTDTARRMHVSKVADVADASVSLSSPDRVAGRRPARRVDHPH
ncbi:histidinol-phosphatase OS=Corynebacterium variabile OX=1727 GN=CVAR292_01655 PE=3 SV=1 [Corynebacterium variabile]